MLASGGEKWDAAKEKGARRARAVGRAAVTAAKVAGKVTVIGAKAAGRGAKYVWNLTAVPDNEYCYVNGFPVWGVCESCEFMVGCLLACLVSVRTYAHVCARISGSGGEGAINLTTRHPSALTPALVPLGMSARDPSDAVTNNVVFLDVTASGESQELSSLIRNIPLHRRLDLTHTTAERLHEFGVCPKNALPHLHYTLMIGLAWANLDLIYGVNVGNMDGDVWTALDTQGRQASMWPERPFGGIRVVVAESPGRLGVQLDSTTRACNTQTWAECFGNVV